MSRAPVVRQARKPTYNTSRLPLGITNKVPTNLRKLFLDDLINEYMKAKYKEEESIPKAQHEEQVIANRASSKIIYRNLIAGLKKRIRDEANDKSPDSSKKDKDNEKQVQFVNGNKVVSHEEILTGKINGTFSIQKKRKMIDPYELSEPDLYTRLEKYVMPIDLLDEYGYPMKDTSKPDDVCMRTSPLGKDGKKVQLREQFASTYTCERCTKVYRVDANGLPLPTTSKCIYHSGHLWNERIDKSLEKRYSCCKGDTISGGCSSNPYHVHRGEFELGNYTGYVETIDKPERNPNRHGIFALDCEMCYTTLGLELTRVTVVNYKQDVVYESLVKPENPVLDYNSKFSGIKEGDLDDIETTIEDVQRDLLKLFSSKSILIGHSLNSDMNALKIFHKKFIDTAYLFPHKRGLPYKRALRTLMVENLKLIIQEDAGHDSKEDASAAFRLVMWKANI